MVVLSAIITTVLLSPLVFALVAAVGLLLLPRRRRAGSWLLAASAVVPLILSTGPVAHFFLSTLERRAEPYEGQPVEAVVVLGGGLVRGSPDEDGKAALSTDAIKRVVYGAIVERRLDVPIVVSGGVVWSSPGAEPEADVATRMLVKIGVDPSRILEDRTSRTTWENARNVAVILRERRIGRIALVTSAYHMPRSLLAFRKAGVDCVPAATDYRADRDRLTAADFLPSYENLWNCFIIYREYLGILEYAVR